MCVCVCVCLCVCMYVCINIFISGKLINITLFIIVANDIGIHYFIIFINQLINFDSCYFFNYNRDIIFYYFLLDHKRSLTFINNIYYI